MKQNVTKNKNAIANNLGHVPFKKRLRDGNALNSFDRMPRELKQWMMYAALPWSPASCAKIWRKMRQKGKRPQEIVQHLARAEECMLEKQSQMR